MTKLEAMCIVQGKLIEKLQQRQQRQCLEIEKFIKHQDWLIDTTCFDATISVFGTCESCDLLLFALDSEWCNFCANLACGQCAMPYHCASCDVSWCGTCNDESNKDDSQIAPIENLCKPCIDFFLSRGMKQYMRDSWEKYE